MRNDAVIIGQSELALERFLDDTRHMIVFDVLNQHSPIGNKGERCKDHCQPAALFDRGNSDGLPLHQAGRPYAERLGSPQSFGLIKGETLIPFDLIEMKNNTAFHQSKSPQGGCNFAVFSHYCA